MLDVPALRLLMLLPCLLLPRAASAQDWPEIFEPTQLRTLNLSLSSTDWTTIQNDDTLSIRVPASFWMDGEAPIQITVRRKSATALTAAAGFRKVSLSLDINDLVLGQSWHGLKKLSLENGDDNNVITEGYAWQVQKLASGTQGYGYPAALANWVRLIINGVDTGVYVNPEKRDKRLLESRGLFVEGQTWLYEIEAKNGGAHILQVGGPADSPTVQTLCYHPFAPSPSCPTPDLATELPQYIDMQGFLTLLAADAFMVAPDGVLVTGKNFYFADFTTGLKRLYFPWDLDSAPRTGGTSTASIYAPRRSSKFAEVLDVPAFRAQYTTIVNDLICGPWSTASLIATADALEPVISAAVDADPNNQLSESSAGTFTALRSWLAARVTHVIGELDTFVPCPTIQLDLNELMASNVGYLEDPDEPGEFPDWFEIHNPLNTSVDIGGVYVTDDPLIPTKHQIPNGVVIPADGYMLFYADNDPEQGDLHIGFNLSAAGEELRLYDRDGATLLDSVSFGPQLSNVAYGRYPNAVGPWDVLPIPTPGAPNVPHNPPPSVSSTTRSNRAPGSGESVGVTSQANDDGSVASVTLFYDIGGGPLPVVMLDDGAHGDGAAGDGTYGATIPPAASDTVVHYWIEATDDAGATAQDPVAGPTAPFGYVVGYEPPVLRINEFMASNSGFIEDPDEPLAYEDWLEIYNPGSSPIALDGMYMSDSLTDRTRYALPNGLVVPAGGFLLLWADFEPAQGIDHLGFQLGAGGESIGLFDTDARGNLPVHTVSFGPQTTNVSEGLCPDGLAPRKTLPVPTPGSANDLAFCGTGQFIPFTGAPTGGAIQITISGVLLTVSTNAGDSLADVVRALADAINADPTLFAAGITASALGDELLTSGTLDALILGDSGISSPLATGTAIAAVPALGTHGLLLLLFFFAAAGALQLRAAARNRG